MIKYNKNKKEWYVKTDKIKAYYSENKYGRYTKYIVSMSDYCNFKFKNIILFLNSYCVLKIISKTYGEQNIIFDINDLDIVLKYKWFLQSSKMQYCATYDENKNNLTLHRAIMRKYKTIPKGMIVDHINRNQFDCRYNNLRIITQKDNCQNKSKRKDNKSGIPGVRKRHNSWVAKWRDENGKEYTKSFSENRFKNAKQLAINERIKHTKHYNKIHILKIKRL